MDAIDLMILNKRVSKEFGIKSIIEKTRWCLTFIPFKIYKHFDAKRKWFFEFRHRVIKGQTPIHCIDLTLFGLRIWCSN